MTYIPEIGAENPYLLALSLWNRALRVRIIVIFMCIHEMAPLTYILSSSSRLAWCWLLTSMHGIVRSLAWGLYSLRALYTVSQITSCSFDKHGLISIILGKQHQLTFINYTHNIFNFPCPFTSAHFVSLLPRDAMQASCGVCVSVCLCVCPSRSYILSKRIKMSSKIFHHRIARPFYTVFQKSSPLGLSW